MLRGSYCANYVLFLRAILSCTFQYESFYSSTLYFVFNIFSLNISLIYILKE